MAKDDRERAAAWRAAQANEQVAGELAAFERAVAQRFGDDGVRAMLRTARGGSAVAAASVSPDQQSALDLVASVTVTTKAAERSAVVAERQAEGERQGHRRGPRM